MRPGLVAFALLVLTGCDFMKSDTFYCSFELAGELQGCMEFSDFEAGAHGTMLRGSFASFCAAAGFGDVGPGACPVENRIGACREDNDDYTLVNWEYDHSMQDDTLESLFCNSDEVLLGPDGTPYDPDPPTEEDAEPVCSPTDASGATSVRVHNVGARPVTVYWGGFDCAEQQMGGPVDGGGFLDVTTTVGHVFRVRAGEGVPDALVLLDFTAEAGGEYEASW